MEIIYGFAANDINYHFNQYYIAGYSENVSLWSFRFGFMTVTYARGGDNSQFDSFLARYASMDCPIITEINIVWNNEQTP